MKSGMKHIGLQQRDSCLFPSKNITQTRTNFSTPMYTSMSAADKGDNEGE